MSLPVLINYPVPVSANRNRNANADGIENSRHMKAAAKSELLSRDPSHTNAVIIAPVTKPDDIHCDAWSLGNAKHVNHPGISGKYLKKEDELPNGVCKVMMQMMNGMYIRLVTVAKE